MKDTLSVTPIVRDRSNLDRLSALVTELTELLEKLSDGSLKLFDLELRVGHGPLKTGESVVRDLDPEAAQTDKDCAGGNLGESLRCDGVTSGASEVKEALESLLDPDVEKIVGHAASPLSSVVPPDSRGAA